MGWSAIVIIEVGLVFGAVLAWGAWQLWSLRKENRRAAERERQALEKTAP